MAKFRTQKNSFIGGEFSPTALGRTELPQYKAACKTLRNMIPMLSGGAYRRPGFMFEAATEKAASFTQGGVEAPWSAKLIPFQVRDDEVYMIALSYSEVESDSVVLTHRAQKYQRALWANVGYVGFGNDPWARRDGYLQAGAADSYAYPTSGYCDYDEWHDVQHTQIGDILFMVHGKRNPFRVERSELDTVNVYNHFNANGFGDVARSAAEKRDSRPYFAQNTTATTLALSATSGSVTVTASADLFDDGHVGAYFKFVSGGATVGAILITAVASATSATATVIVSPDSGAAAATWWEQAWSNYRGWPRVVFSFRNRIGYASTKSNPDSLWFSEAFDYDQLSVSDEANPESGPTGDEPFTFTLGQALVREILWVNAENTLTVGLGKDEWLIEDGASGFGGDSISATRKSKFGSVSRQIAQNGNELIFQARDGLRSLVYSDEQQAYTSEPIQVLFDEYPKVEGYDYGIESYTNSAGTLKRKIRAMAWDEQRSTLWVVDTAGNLFGCTRDRQLGITAWHSHEHGAYDEDDVQTLPSNVLQPDYASPRGFISSVAVLPNIGTEGTDLWICVKAGHLATGWVFTLERMMGAVYPRESAYDFPSEVDYGAGMYFTDSCVFDHDTAGNGTLTGLAATNNKGFAHLEGDSVRGTALCARGVMPLPAVTVASGVVEMGSSLPGFSDGEDYAFAYGLPFNSYLIPVRPDEGSVIGSAQGAIKRIHEANIRFYRTVGAVQGRDADNVEELVFREAATLMGKAAELYTGDKRVKVNSTYDRDGYIYIGQHEPLPQCIVSVSCEGQLYD